LKGFGNGHCPGKAQAGELNEKEFENQPGNPQRDDRQDASQQIALCVSHHNTNIRIL